ncbi:TPR repeat-containing protein [Rippkaea orientalis PCC 8801]|uniref:TPR repeat-containing protein n=1 Tax=Rippkaea orientalis (strain PCC 8801 / RF-1) TaxID=41431 RepID=B7JZE7_RIPO1|nr:tetratricopeptide repeat protein [Rippkaea orientalis]ACK67358.1 TPR repeat-containing protein [Rippkaea orientalis PCC 8801]
MKPLIIAYSLLLISLLGLFDLKNVSYGSQPINPSLRTQRFSHDPNLNELIIRGIEKGIQGDYQGAIADFNQVILINPNEVEAYHSRGIAYIKLGNYSQAIADFNNALGLNPNIPEIYQERAKIRLILSDKAGAIADLQTAAELFKQQGNTFSYQETQKLLRDLQPR